MVTKDAADSKCLPAAGPASSASVCFAALWGLLGLIAERILFRYFPIPVRLRSGVPAPWSGFSSIVSDLPQCEGVGEITQMSA